jgi:hypothetical protein
MEKNVEKKKALKLTLHRETLRKLEEAQLENVVGGATANTCYRSCLATCFC